MIAGREGTLFFFFSHEKKLSGLAAFYRNAMPRAETKKKTCQNRDFPLKPRRPLVHITITYSSIASVCG